MKMRPVGRRSYCTRSRPCASDPHISAGNKQSEENWFSGNMDGNKVQA